MRQPYLRVIHLEMASASSGGPGGANPFGLQFTPAEEEEFGEMARSEMFYERFAKSVGPSIYGSLGRYSPRLSSISAHFRMKTSKRQ